MRKRIEPITRVASIVIGVLALAWNTQGQASAPDLGERLTLATDTSLIGNTSTNRPATVVADTAKKAGAVALEEELKNLAPTGSYVIRYVRIPAGKAGETKLIKFLVPVLRERKPLSTS